MFWSSSWTIIPHLVVTSFAHAAARLAGEEYLGLLLAPHLTIASKGRWAGYMLGAPTLGEAIRRGIATIGFHSKGDVMSLVAGNGEARLSYMSAARGQTGYIHVALGSVGIVLSLCRAFLPAHWQPLRIELDIPRPPSTTAFEDVFGNQTLRTKVRNPYEELRITSRSLVRVTIDPPVAAPTRRTSRTVPRSRRRCRPSACWPLS